MIAIESARTKRLLFFVAGITTILFFFLLGRACAPAPETDNSHAHEHDEPASEGDEQMYYCSMHPDQQSTDPDATCPICGMDMVPMPSEDEQDDGERAILRVGERAAALLQVDVAPVERREGDHRLGIQGHVELAETRLTDVVARSEGFVERQQAEHLWQEVEKGEPLASIYSPDVTAAARELLVIQRNSGSRAGHITVESGKEKLRRLGAPESYIRRVLESKDVPRTYRLRSPASGVITEIDGREGHAMKEGERHVQIADLSRVWVQLEAYEEDLPWLRAGQPATVRARAFPDRSFSGEVTFIDPAVDSEQRTVRVRIEVENQDGSLKPGMFVRGTIDGSTADAAELEEAPLIIPRSAPLITGKRAVVYVQREEDGQIVYEGRDVELGSRVGDTYRVHEGLEEGELVVTRGAFRIDSELQIRGRPSMMTPDDVFAEDDSEADPAAPLVALAADEVPEDFLGGVETTLQRYFELADALAHDDLDRAQAATSEMQAALADVDPEGLGGETEAAWDELLLALHAPLAEMAKARDLEALRGPLEALAEPMERIAKIVEGATETEIYRAACPMTESGDARWLQPDDAISNPYMGQEMPECGSIEQVTR